MNVLDANQVPRVMSLAEVLRAFSTTAATCCSAAPSSGWPRSPGAWRSSKAISCAYLNIDEVIRIIRTEDEPKAVMMKRWKLTDLQADAILNMRLRALRKLEEIEIKTEHKNLTGEQKDLNALLKSEDKQWDTDRRRDRRAEEALRRRRPSWAAAAPSWARRRRPSSSRSKPWSSASR